MKQALHEEWGGDLMMQEESSPPRVKKGLPEVAMGVGKKKSPRKTIGKLKSMNEDASVDDTRVDK